MAVMMMTIVLVIKAAYETVSVADSRHLFFLVDGHEGDDNGNSDDDRGCI